MLRSALLTGLLIGSPAAPARATERASPEHETAPKDLPATHAASSEQRKTREAPRATNGASPAPTQEPQTPRATRRALPELSVELHSHLFMSEALGWMFRGRFDGPLAADAWHDRLSSKANAEALEASGIGIVVVALFAHPVYASDMREVIRRQIDAAEEFVKTHPHWGIARSPEEAARLLRSGRRVMVLSLEGASGVLESEEDLREFIDERGIRIVTPLHLVDDRFGGAATLNGFQYFANPLVVVDQLMDPHCNDSGMRHNERPLSALGKRLMVALIKRGVWIDIAHASDASLAGIKPLIARAKQPLLLSHSSLRRYRNAERMLSDEILKAIAKSRGILGLMPSEDAFETIEVPRRFCPAPCRLEQCQGGVNAFAKMYTEVSEVVGSASVMLGSDYSGGVRHLAQSCGTGTSLDEPAGLYHIGQNKEVWAALPKTGASVPPLSQTLARFLEAWQAVHAIDLEPTLSESLPSLPPRKLVAGPSLAGGLQIGLLSSLESGPDLWLGAHIRLRKDHGPGPTIEPTAYFLRTRAQMSTTLADGRVTFAKLRLAPVGIGVEEGDNSLLGELLPLTLARHEALDQDGLVRLAAFGGSVSTMPGLWKTPGQHHLFLALDLELAGYKGYRTIALGATRQGFYLGASQLTLGAAINPLPGVVLALRAAAEADMTFLTRGAEAVPYQSDLDLHAGIELGTEDRRFSQFFEAHWLASREVSDAVRRLSTSQLRGGISLAY